MFVKEIIVLWELIVFAEVDVKKGTIISSGYKLQQISSLSLYSLAKNMKQLD